MVISGNTLPVVANSQTNPNRADSPRSKDPRAQSGAQQTAEYVFRVEIEDGRNQSRSAYQSYNQQIDPANIRAIYSYTDIEKNSPNEAARQGRMLDIFI